MTRRILIQTTSIARLAADIAHQRLFHQRLVGPLCRRPEEVVEGLLAVQAQDFYGAKWAIAQRTQDGSDAAVDEAYDDGRILRTHVLRPTWHFVAAADLGWLLELTAPRVHAANAYMYRKCELDEALLRRADARLVRTLEGGKQLAREELGEALAAGGIEASGTRLACLVMHAELEGLIVSGLMRGKQHTYTLMSERVRRPRKLRRDEALAELARRYLRGHGPAQVQDLAWWSGLTQADAKKAFDLIGADLEKVPVADAVYFRAPLAAAAPRRTTTIHLLPNYDELAIAFKDHAVTLDEGLGETDRGELERMNLVARNGRMIGGWKRTLARDQVSVEVTLLVPVSDSERDLLGKAAKRYAESLGLTLDLKLEMRS